MQVDDWIDEPLGSLLDVGCNVGAWLKECSRRHPSARLAGVEINATTLEVARENAPGADLHRAGAEDLPFPIGEFEYVTCVEVLEHLPADLRLAAFREMHRVLKPGGRLILTVPHAGWFGWLDANNVRLRLPRLYRWSVGAGRRDAAYTAVGRDVEWHHHFDLGELERLAGSGWDRVAVQRGGLVLYPLMDWMSWPFYRLGIPDHPVRRAMERVAGWDYRIDFAAAPPTGY